MASSLKRLENSDPNFKSLGILYRKLEKKNNTETALKVNYKESKSKTHQISLKEFMCKITIHDWQSHRQRRISR